MLRSKLFDGLKRISGPFRTRNPHRDGASRGRGFRRPRLECLERRELLSLSGWSFAVGGPDDDCGMDTAVDTAGNVYVTGQFNGTVDFDPGGGVEELTSLGGMDLFVAKYTPSGDLLWARPYDYPGEPQNVFSEIAVDALGNATVTFGDEHIWGLDADGDDRWLHTIVGDRVDANDVAVDAARNIYIAGTFSETAVFGTTASDESVSLTNVRGSYLDIFVAKYSPSGEVIWAQRAGSSSTDWANGITVDDDGNVYLAGQARVGADFGDHTASLPQAERGKPQATELDIFVAKMDAAGTFQWVSMAGGTGFDQAEDVTVDSFGNVYITGDFGGGYGGASALFGTDTINNAGDYDIFAAKLDPSGNFLWARGMGGPGRDSGDSISADDSGVYVAGYFGDPDGTGGDFGPFGLTGSAGFLTKLDVGNGNVLSAQEISWWVTDVSVSSDGAVHLTGGLSTDTSGEEFPTGETLVSVPGPPQPWFPTDIFVSKMEPGVPNIRSLVVSPEPVVQGDTLTLSAHGVLDVGDGVASVAFYWDANGDGFLNADTEWLDTDTDVLDAWSYSVDTTDFILGTHKFWAVATDYGGYTSEAVAAIGEVVEGVPTQPETYNSTDVPKTIADNKIATTTIDISGTGVSIADLTVQLNLTHASPSDLTAWLIAPDGTTSFTLDSGGATPILDGIHDYAVPSAANLDLDGVWTLKVEDSLKNRKRGTLFGWSMVVEPAPIESAQSQAAAVDQALLAWLEPDSADDDGTDPLTESLIDDLALMLVE